MEWYVLYTKPHNEIRVANSLERIGIRSYCPVFKQVKQYSDRKKKVVTPLIRSYVMVNIGDKERDRVFDIPGVIRYVYWLGKPAIVRDKEIQLMEKTFSGIYQGISITNIKKGANHTIQDGPFKGQSGEVINILNKSIKLELASLGVIVTLKTA